jgi:hypothetical protein
MLKSCSPWSARSCASFSCLPKSLGLIYPSNSDVAWRPFFSSIELLQELRAAKGARRGSRLLCLVRPASDDGSQSVLEALTLCERAVGTVRKDLIY